MASNYPPGVTGNEYAIGGAEAEWEAVETCPHCGWEGPMPHEAHYEFGVRAFCANPELVEVVRAGEGFATALCPLVQEGFELPTGPDPDALYDEMRDAQRENR